MNYNTIFFDGYGTLFDTAFDALYETCQIIVDDLQIDMSKEAFLDHWDRYFFPLLKERRFYLVLGCAYYWPGEDVWGFECAGESRVLYVRSF